MEPGDGFTFLPVELKSTYFYFEGRFFLYSDDYDGARESLKAAFELLEGSNKDVVKSVARYLVPLYMHRGKMPQRAFLEKYELVDEYAEIASAIENGLVGEFDKLVD